MKRFSLILFAAALISGGCGKEVPQDDPAPAPGDYIDEYGVNHGQGIQVGGIVWAPVNCGYKAVTADDKGYPDGKLYQWGRKYGQGYYGEDRKDAGVDYKAEGPLSLEIATSERYATVFITAVKDWLDPSDDSLWNKGTEESPIKTQYDPCPEGWRVPTRAELDHLLTLMTGWKVNEKKQLGAWFSDGKGTLFLPQTPYRAFSGEFYPALHSGYYWSSMPGWQFSGIKMNVNAENPHTSNSSRPSAYAVRCVKE